MNWKDAPNLFANEKFELESQYEVIDVIEWIYDKDYYDCSGQRFKLIARPISDMSDEEIANLNPNIKLDRHHLINAIQNNELMLVEARNLLSIGVYPFDQDNPKDVIWRYQND